MNLANLRGGPDNITAVIAQVGALPDAMSPLATVERAAVETDLPPEAFPVECGYSVDELLSFDPVADDA